MVKLPPLLALAFLSTASLAASAADCDNGICLPQPPDIPAYMAYEIKPTRTQEVESAFTVKGLKGLYFSGIIGPAFLRVNDIERVGAADTTDPNALVSSATQSSINKTVPFYGANMGYVIPFFRIPSRIEIEYLYYKSLDYNPSPAINNFVPAPTLNSTFHTQTVMGNLYYDIDFGSRFVPYLGAGAGAAFNNTDGTLTDNVNPPVSFDKTNTSFAWNARLGLRFKATPSFILDAGYQFVWLGKARWPLPAVPFFGNQQLETNDIYTNSLMFKLTWEFA